MSDEHAPLRSYGRLKTRQLKPRQAGLLESELPRLTVPLGLDPRTLRPEASELWLEIGFGGGEHMAEQAARHPYVLLLGAEPFVNGVASAVRHLHERGLANVRLHQGDARDLLAGLPDACLSRVFILFPDPWPKARHNKRRLLQPAFIESLARVMAPGACLRFATDWRDYAAWTLERMVKSSAFNWTAESAADWRTPPADHVTTRYEEKRLGDCAPIFLEFVRGDSC
jgi:tRNA (guanine-N7-)-methyltransferase